MALQVWLPLNGDLKNKGCADTTVTNNGATVDNNGKIGKCYSFTNQNIVVPSTNFKNKFTNNQATITTWVKVNANHNSYAQALILGTQGTSWNNILFGIDINGSGTPIANASTGSAYTNLSFGTTIKDGIWHHLAYTYDNGTMTVYLDGVQKGTTVTSNAPAWTNSTNLYIGGNSGGEKFQNGDGMNDVRIYNHCLSAAEVKEISRGLVLHYKLDESTPSQNLLTGNFSVYKTTTTVNKSGSLTTIPASTILANKGKTLTLSAKIYSMGNSVNTTSQNRFGIHGVVKLTQSEGTSTQWYPLQLFDVGKDGGRYSVSWTIPSDTTSVDTDFSWADQASSTSGWYGAPADSGVTWYFKDVKLEWGEVATEFYGNDNVIDSSGYGNHGTVAGNLSLSYDSPRYNCSTLFDGSNNVIKSTLNLCTDYKYTASFWIKPTRISGATQWIFALSNNTTSEHQFGCFINQSNIITQVGGTVNGLQTAWTHQNSAGVLQHIAIVSDGENVEVYVNGVSIGTDKKNGNYTGTTFWIGERPGAPNSYNYDGILSDFRIYATALSAEDVKQLYEVSAKIDNKSNLHSYELVENNLTSIKKNGTANFDFEERNTNATIYKQVNSNLLQGTIIDNLRYERTSGMGTEFGRQFVPTEQLQIGTDYTFSAMIRGNANMNLYTINTGGNVAFAYANRGDMDENEFRLFSVTFKVTGDRTINAIYPCSRYGEANTSVGDWYELQANSIKLEEGTMCTPWIPAETDTPYRTYNSTFVAKQLIEM